MRLPGRLWFRHPLTVALFAAVMLVLAAVGERAEVITPGYAAFSGDHHGRASAQIAPSETRIQVAQDGHCHGGGDCFQPATLVLTFLVPAAQIRVATGRVVHAVPADQHALFPDTPPPRPLA